MFDCFLFLFIYTIESSFIFISEKAFDMDDWWERESLIKYETPTSIFIAAPSVAGKTELTRQILKHADGMLKTFPSSIYLCYSMWQNLHDEIQNGIKNIQLYEGLPSMEE